MPDISLKIPQIGEGLQEARLVAVLKQPGDTVKRDEPIYQMETDKAVMDVESPYAGVLKAWLANPDELLAIGADVAIMEVDGEVEPMAVGHESNSSVEEASPSVSSPANPEQLRQVPPRTRAYAKEKGLTDAQMIALVIPGQKLMPEDIDAALATSTSTGSSHTSATGHAHTESPLSSSQRLLSSRLTRGNALVVPGTMSVVMEWASIERQRARVKASGSDFQPSAFTMLAYAAVLALKEHAQFRSSLSGENIVRTYENVNLGIAVALPGDELVIATVDKADTMSFSAFAAEMKARIELARSGKDQAHEAVTVSLTNMQSFGLRDAIPVVVPPAVGTLFLGEPYNALKPNGEEIELMRVANLALTFDHRLINGVGAANFLNDVKKFGETVSQWVDK